MRRLAGDLADVSRIARSLAKTQQISRTVINTPDSTISVPQLAEDSVDVKETVDEHELTLDQVNESTSLEFDSWYEMQPGIYEDADQTHTAFMSAIETSERVNTAQDAADAAAQAAANAQTTADGKNARRRGQMEPLPPEGGWQPGDQWIVDNTNGVPVEVRVWNGTQFVSEQLLSSELLVLGENGTVQIKDGAITAPMISAGALDAITIKSPQIYGGYIEAPTIASSSKLGSGANRLNDPFFEGAINSAWVASGHLGDAAVKQTDNVEWNQAWNWYYDNRPTPTRYVNAGRLTADLNMTPRTRQTNTIVFANYSWFNSANRQINDPYTFRALYGTSIEGQNGGRWDPTFEQVFPPAFKTATARTTYLTNSAIIGVVAGESWNLRLTAQKLTAEQVALMSVAEIQVINASTNAVIWSHALPRESLMAGDVNVFWNSTFTGNVKYRIRATYTAGGGTITRVPSPSSWATFTRSGSLSDSWSGTESQSAVYGSSPYEEPGLIYVSGDTFSASMVRRAQFDWKPTNAIFSKVEGGRGWRLSEESGLELYNSLGAKTAQLDGENNFFSGRIASAETGARWEIVRDKMSLFDGTNTEIANIRRDGIYMRFGGSIRADGDIGWSRLDSGSIPGATLGPGMVHGVNSLYVGFQARIQDGVLYLSGRLERTGGIPANHVLFSLPAGFRSPVPDVSYAYSGGDNFVVLQPNGDCILALAATSYVTISKMVIPLRN